MKRVRADSIVDEIEQLRVNLGWSKAEASRQAGHKTCTEWAQLTRTDRHAMSHLQFRVIERMLETVGYALYIGPLPKEEECNGES